VQDEAVTQKPEEVQMVPVLSQIPMVYPLPSSANPGAGDRTKQGKLTMNTNSQNCRRHRLYYQPTCSQFLLTIFCCSFSDNSLYLWAVKKCVPLLYFNWLMIKQAGQAKEMKNHGTTQ